MHDYAVGDIVYVVITDIYRKLDFKKQWSYRTTELFTHSTVWFQIGQLNKHINIRRLKSHFIE